MVTDGVPNQGPDPVPIARSMRTESGTDIFAVGVGSGVDESLLEKLAPGQVFLASNFTFLQSVLQTLAFSTCAAISGIQPSSGPEAGGTAVVIDGTGLDVGQGGTIYVLFGAKIVKGIVGDSTSVGAISPSGTGTVAISVSFDGKNWVSNGNVTFIYQRGSCPNQCSGHGQCLAGKCICNTGWTGPDCSTQSCPVQDCSGHGNCINGQCQCQEGWYGSACENQNVICCVYCGIYNPTTQEDHECQLFTPGGPKGSPCKGYSDKKFITWWYQQGMVNGHLANCTSEMNCILPGGVWVLPRGCVSSSGYCLDP
jgi:hypothetical protein